MRRMRFAVGFAIALTVATTAGLATAGGVTAAAAASDPVATIVAAPANALARRTAVVAFHVRGRFGPDALYAGAAGPVDFARGAAQLHVAIPLRPREPLVHADLTLIGAEVWLRLPPELGGRGGDRPWVHVDLARLGMALGDVPGIDAGLVSDPVPIVGALSDVRVAGPGRFHGVRVTRYTFTAGLAGLVQLPFEMWVDRAGRMRWLSVYIPVADTDTSPPGSISLTLELLRLGVRVNIAPPDASRVTELVL